MFQYVRGGGGRRASRHGYQQSPLQVVHLADLLGQVHDADLVLEELLPLGVPRLLGRLVVLHALLRVRHVVRGRLTAVAALLVGRHRSAHLLVVARRSQAVHVPLPERLELGRPVDVGNVLGVHVRVVADDVAVATAAAAAAHQAGQVDDAPTAALNVVRGRRPGRQLAAGAVHSVVRIPAEINRQ